ncbi:uncharacterized protein SCHCODRAFT_01211887 [Schizophyllum commune H4-8]|nr:uncharacterized protein SCHCODRAFT_01211887 [Schizophyllum commune H4-8]KAI5895873.1 hypothetical protein SCHCODRAFT_01211887 [Schizophyllum commune H4-8]
MPPEPKPVRTHSIRRKPVPDYDSVVSVETVDWMRRMVETCYCPPCIARTAEYEYQDVLAIRKAAGFLDAAKVEPDDPSRPKPVRTNSIRRKPVPKWDLADFENTPTPKSEPLPNIEEIRATCECRPCVGWRIDRAVEAEMASYKAAEEDAQNVSE